MTESNQVYNMDNLWDIMSSDNSQWGIPGYKVPPLTVDCIKIKKDSDQLIFMDKVWKGKEVYPKPKLNIDKDGKEILPRKPSCYDPQEKSLNFGYSKEKEEALKELYKSKNRTLEEYVEKVNVEKLKEKAKIYRYDRITYFESITRQEKKNQKYFPHMEEIIQKTKEIIEKSPKKLIKSEEIKLKYANRGSIE